MGHSRSAISGLLLLFFLLGFNGGSVSAANYVAHKCPNTTSSTPDSTYRRDLDSLLSSLSSNATVPSGFYNLSAGAAYGLFTCRGDLFPDACGDCVQTAAADLVKKCPNQRTAVIWYNECWVRYSNWHFFSVVATEPSMRLNGGDVADPDRFMELLGTTMGDTAGRAAAGRSGRRFAVGEAQFTASLRLYTMAQCTADLSAGDCSACLVSATGYFQSCCDGKFGGRVLFPSCIVWFETSTSPFYNSNSIALPPPPPPSPPPVMAPPPEEEKEKGKISAVTIVAIVVPVFVFMVLLIIGYCIVKRRAKKQYNAAAQEHNDEDEISNVESLEFDLSAIEAATNNFSARNRLGAGGFGEVFKGTLPNGELIAVRRLSRSSASHREQEFKNEAVLVAKLQHRNLVRLLGFCLEGQEKILVYEFVPNKSLDYFLFDPEKQGILGWSGRYKIVGGIARGILYLHEDSRLRIIHRNLKASNILLDGEMNPKISDFGMAKIFGVDQTQGNTSRIVGTFGYMSPEYAMQGIFSVKSDVYGFGILILEIISGNKCTSFCQEGAEDLISYAWKLWMDETPLSLVDPTLRDSYSSNEVVRCIHIALLCVQEDPSKRPPMASIVLMLNSYSLTLAVDHITNLRPLQFKLSTIEAATNKLSDDNKLGQGGFGPVYKGTLPDGQEIAVKKLSNNSGQGAKEFKNEVGLVAKLQHRNLVKLLGFCLERKEKMLVYEYVCNKSLDYFLYDPTKKELLDWPTRKKVIVDIARGIMYLHEDSRLTIIHCDLKTSNILLDEKMNAKIADFGIARIFNGTETHERTKNIVGTHGYMAPEYRIHGQFSVKSDVFSFGIILLEIITGKKSIAIFETDGAENLLTYVWKHWIDGTPMKLMDPSLGKTYSEKEVMRCIHVGLLCVQENAGERPVMSLVLLMLNRYFALPSPQRPAFLIWSRTDWNLQTESATTHCTEEDSVVCSVNKLTNTELEVYLGEN